MQELSSEAHECDATRPDMLMVAIQTSERWRSSYIAYSLARVDSKLFNAEQKHRIHDLQLQGKSTREIAVIMGTTKDRIRRLFNRTSWPKPSGLD